MSDFRQVKEPNLDPVIYQPDGRGGAYALTDWVGWCLAYVATAYGSGWAGSTAWEAWNKTTKRRHTDRNFPVGVKLPIWFSGFDGDGHVAILEKSPKGVITIWTSPYKAHRASAEIVHSIEEIEQDLRSHDIRYVGWSEDIGGTQVISKILGDEMATKPDIAILRIVHSEMEGWPLVETHAGKFDKQFEAAQIDRPDENTNELVHRKWTQNGAYRESREVWRKFYEQYNSQITVLLDAKKRLEAAEKELAELKSKGVVDKDAVELKNLILKLADKQR